MKERKLPFNTDNNPELVSLDEKTKAKTLKTALDLCFTAKELHSRLEKNCLETGFCNTLLSLLESHIVNLHKTFNYESKLKQEYEQRFVQIRSLNEENRELRRQLGQKVSPEDVREFIKNAKDAIDKWWTGEGMGHVSEVSFHGYCCCVKLSGNMFFHEKENQREYLTNKGYELTSRDNGSDCTLAGTDKNIELLGTEILKRFPSAKIVEINISNYGSMHIRDCVFYIRDFSDIVKQGEVKE